MKPLHSITQLKIKLAGGTEPLEEIAKLCRLATNAAVEDWLLRHRGKPESDKQAKFNSCTGKALSESTKLYHAITAAVPQLHSQAASVLAGQVNANLSAKIDWRRGAKLEGKRERRRDAILRYDDRPPFTSQLQIPLHNKCVALECGDRFAIVITVERGLSREIELSTRRMPPRFKRILREIASGQRRLAVSRLVGKDGKWFWFLPVQFEREPLDTDVICELIPRVPEEDQPVGDWFFDVLHPGGRKWSVGDGRYLLSQTRRLIALRKQIGWRYRQRNGAGHGRAKIDAAVRKRVKQQADIVAEVRRRAICDVIRQCERSGAGHLLYREPTNPAKDCCWFAAAGLDWDWTRFAGDLKNACHRAGITVSVAKLKLAEVAHASA